jgi:monosaccharide-transporting ATPase
VLAGHSIAVQQMVAIARAVDISAKILILDEPTSSLDTGEVEQLFRVVRGLRDQGLAIVFVTHFLDQVYEIADRITVLRNGQLVGEYRTAELPQRDLVEKMIGKELQVLERLVLPDRSSETLLDADQVGRTGAIAPFSLTIHAGEVVGLAGLLGSGRSELARLFFGADKMDSGELRVDGSPVTLRGPRSAMEHDIAYLSENRRAEGLIEELSVRENVILALQAARGWSRPLSRAKQDELVTRYIEALSIRPADPNMPVRNLSGGNQQKVLLARWLITEPRLLILDEPTRGIDVGAKADIQRLVVKLAGDGLAVLFISAELEEVLRLSHKIAVLRDRVVVAQMENTPDVDANTVMNVIASGAAG